MDLEEGLGVGLQVGLVLWDGWKYYRCDARDLVRLTVHFIKQY